MAYITYSTSELETRVVRYKCCFANTGYSLLKSEQNQTDNKGCLTNKFNYLNQGIKTLERYIKKILPLQISFDFSDLEDLAYPITRTFQFYFNEGKLIEVIITGSSFSDFLDQILEVFNTYKEETGLTPVLDGNIIYLYLGCKSCTSSEVVLIEGLNSFWDLSDLGDSSTEYSFFVVRNDTSETIVNYPTQTFATRAELISSIVGQINDQGDFLAYSIGDTIWLQEINNTNINVELDLTVIIPGTPNQTVDRLMGVGRFPELEQLGNPLWINNPFTDGWEINNDTTPSCIDYTFSTEGFIRVNTGDYLGAPPGAGYVSFNKDFTLDPLVASNRFKLDFIVTCQAGVFSTIKFFVDGSEQLSVSSNYSTFVQLPIVPQSAADSFNLEVRVHVGVAHTDPYITISRITVQPVAEGWIYSSDWTATPTGLYHQFSGSNAQVLYAGPNLTTGNTYTMTVNCIITSGTLTFRNGTTLIPLVNGLNVFNFTVQASSINFLPASFIGYLISVDTNTESEIFEYNYDLDTADITITSFDAEFILQENETCELEEENLNNMIQILDGYCCDNCQDNLNLIKDIND